jgi:uncharacterized RDD family membrane protein YckC
MESPRLVYAGFWRRGLAAAIDGALLGIPLFVIGLAVGRELALLIAFAAYPIYFILFERSAWRATPGKALLKLRAVELGGDRLSTGRAVWRTVAKLVSAGSGGCGFLVAAFTPEKQAVHDLMASTLVIRGAKSENEA